MNVTVYYLDDETEICESFLEYMTIKGLNAAAFEDERAFIAACRESPPDVAFLDYRLTATTGDRVAARLDPSIKKVLVTGDLTNKHGEVFVEALAKPFRLRQAYELILTLCAEATPADGA